MTVKEKTMERLAEVLRENGIRVVQVIDRWVTPSGNVIPSMVTFKGDEAVSSLAVKLALENDYPLVRLDRRWVYLYGTAHNPYWAMTFRTSLIESVGSHSSFSNNVVHSSQGSSSGC